MENISQFQGQDNASVTSPNNPGANIPSDSKGYQETTDPNVIQEWAEVRGGTPVRDMNDVTQLKIIFDENSDNSENLQKVSWEEFLELFAENNFKFCYKEEAEDGTLSREYTIVREDRSGSEDNTAHAGKDEQNDASSSILP